MKRNAYTRPAASLALFVLTCLVASITFISGASAAGKGFSNVKKVAVVVRQYDVVGKSKMGRKKVLSQPMAWGVFKQSGSSIGFGGNVSFKVSKTRPMQLNKETKKLRRVISTMDMVGIVRNDFIGAVRSNRSVAIADMNQVKSIYEKTCPESKRERRNDKIKKNRARDRLCEEALANKGIADAVIYIDIGPWGYEMKPAASFKMKGHASLGVGISMWDTKTGNKLASGDKQVSYSVGKYARKSELNDIKYFIADDGRKIQSALKDTSREIAPMLVGLLSN